MPHPIVIPNFDLKPYNTFGINAKADHAVFFEQTDQWEAIRELYLQYAPQVAIIGGGSNILLTKDLPGLVIFNRLKGIEVVEETEETVLLKVGAGEEWHAFVMHCVSQNWGGVENLALIPGCVGAAPMQNIGAYGVEIKDVLVAAEVLEWSNGQKRMLSAEECQFGYRSSIFKTTCKGQFLISAIIISLKKNPSEFRVSYGDLQQTLLQMGVQQDDLTVKAVADAVMAIRRSKLPDPARLGNAGSFFKNPEIPVARANALRLNYPDMPVYELPGDMAKVPAGWLIEQCGWKGKRVGHTGNHERQALVIVNYGEATGPEIWAHALAVQASVQEKFDISLEPEVNIIPG